MTRDSFIFYRGFLEAADSLDGDLRKQFICAVVDYGINGTITHFTNQVAHALFTVACLSIDTQTDYMTIKRAKEGKRQRRIKDCSSPELFLTTNNATREAKTEFIKRYILNKEPFDVPDSINTLSAMPYSDFLKTPYWKAIAIYIKNRDKRQCQICGGKQKLCVHHKTYKHHGDELNHLDDLMCVCNTCHKHIHEKNQKTT